MPDERIHTLRLRTPEGVAFSFFIASPVVRLAAWFVDKSVVAASWSLVSTVLLLIGLFDRDLARGVSIIGFFVVSLGYGIACEWLWRGQTLGKRLLRLRVLDARGLRLGFAQVALRNLLRAVDVLPMAYLVGGVSSLLSTRGQRLGDLAAGTIVVWEPDEPAPDFDLIGAGKYNSLRAFPHVAGRLRQTVLPLEARAALQSILRRDRLDPQARVRLFEELAAHFKGLAEIPPEALEGISDEQFVRNLIDSLFVSGSAARAKAA
jgi:uncharacterized RDD family membrane protein YckC